jgi:peptide/nickel transport system substrate-binding protein
VKIDVRWQLLLAVICIGLVWSLLGYQLQTVGLCSTRVPSSGGRLVEGMIGQPQFINPLLSDGNPVDQELVDLIFDGLTRYNDKGELEPVLSQSWQVSEDGHQVSFELREDITWHDGQPFTAKDVAFTYGLLQTEDFPVSEGLKSFWESVVISQTGLYQVDFILPQPYGPFLDATTRGILPAHLLENIPPSEHAEHAYNRLPIGTGPFLVSPGSDLQRDGRLVLAPNPSYWRQGIQIDGLEFRFFPDTQALANAYSEGEIQAITSVPTADVPIIAALDGVRLFSAATLRFTQLIFNLSENGSKVVANREVREALSIALDREALVDKSINGQGLPLEGPYVPNSWAYRPDLLRTYRYDPATAAIKLDSAGWAIPEGSSKRQQGGQLLEIHLLVPSLQEHLSLANYIKEQWSQLGIETELQIVSPDELRQKLAERDFDVALINIEPEGDPDLYDFWSQEAIIRGQNYGGWNNRRASEALESARQLSVVDDRMPYYEAFLRYFDEDLPALTLYQHVNTYALSDSVNDAELGRIDSPRDRYETLAEWFLLYREVAVACPQPDA